MQDAPSSRQARWRWLALGVAGAIVLALFALSLGVTGFIRSDRFRQLISRQTSAFLRVEGEFMPVHWTGFSAYSDGFLGRGEAVREIRADQIRAEFYPSGILRRAWEINDLEIQRLNIILGDGLPATPTRPAARRSLWLPDRLDLQQVRIQNASVEWSSNRLQNVRALLTPDGAAWNIEVAGGDLRHPGWPVVNIDRLKLRYRAPELFVTEGQLKLGESELINVSGEASPSGVNFGVRFRGIIITPFLPEDWRARLKGKAAGDAKVTLAGVTGSLALDAAQLEALPVLDRIALFTQTVEFRRLNLQTARADFSWSESKLTIRNLVIESPGLLRVEGGCDVVNDRLEGVFQVGVAPGTLRWLPGAQNRVFTLDRDGYVWTSVRVTGPLDRLEEDLSGRLARAAGTEAVEGVTGTVEKGARQLLDLLKPLTP